MRRKWMGRTVGALLLLVFQVLRLPAATPGFTRSALWSQQLCRNCETSPRKCCCRCLWTTALASSAFERWLAWAARTVCTICNHQRGCKESRTWCKHLNGSLAVFSRRAFDPAPNILWGWWCPGLEACGDTHERSSMRWCYSSSRSNAPERTSTGWRIRSNINVDVNDPLTSALASISANMNDIFKFGTNVNIGVNINSYFIVNVDTTQHSSV